MRSRRVDRNLRTIETADPTETGAIRWALSHRPPRMPRPQRRTVAHRLMRILRSHEHPTIREWAAYALHRLPRGAADPRPILLRAALDDPDVAVRAQALEVVGSLCAYRSGPMVERTAAALPSLLAHEEPELRFWALYAVGQMRRSELRDAVSALVGDPVVVSGLWTVGEEAADVLLILDGGVPPDRTPAAAPRAPSPSRSSD